MSWVFSVAVCDVGYIPGIAEMECVIDCSDVNHWSIINQWNAVLIRETGRPISVLTRSELSWHLKWQKSVVSYR